MDSRAKALGHAMHPMLIVFPLGLLTTAVVFDILYLITDRPGFPIAAAYAVAGGVLGGLAASLPGWVDWSAIPVGTRAKRVGLLHGVGNLVVVVLFALSWLLRAGAVDWEPEHLGVGARFRRGRAEGRDRLARRRAGGSTGRRGHRRRAPGRPELPVRSPGDGHGGPGRPRDGMTRGEHLRQARSSILADLTAGR